jgi:hypothetical protein
MSESRPTPRLLYGIDLPTSGEYADVRLLAGLAAEAEAAGWDGFFLYDQVAPEKPLPLVDPWICLAAIAISTRRIKLGTLVTPLARRRPWKVARETVSLDQLSGGRLVLGVGLGIQPEEFDHLGEESDPRTRAEMLDEALDLLVQFWSGKPFRSAGKHYQVQTDGFQPLPVKQGDIPVWVGGTWPNMPPFRRAARWQGVFPHYKKGGLMPVEEFISLVGFIRQQRGDIDGFDFILRGSTPGNNPSISFDLIHPYLTAGLTWWLEGIQNRSLGEVQERIRQGPPRLNSVTKFYAGMGSSHDS